ncbi:hypothetical protein DPMN_042386 [Dreissena polymorpha]|uniref:Uncharacterized protein n=1 Tax=Dreissena polymorpha TaxID=45954 RepID=A0A9D4D1Y5_DREPO|nr:hypothetical protein DPMN_042386 [Dreissena polymorpha]
MIVGTNVLRFLQALECEDIFPAWQSAIAAVSLSSSLGNVVSTSHRPIEIQPYQTLTLSGMVRKLDNECIAITEPSESCCKGLGVCPRVVVSEVLVQQPACMFVFSTFQPTQFK